MSRSLKVSCFMAKILLKKFDMGHTSPLGWIGLRTCCNQFVDLNKDPNSREINLSLKNKKIQHHVLWSTEYTGVGIIMGGGGLEIVQYKNNRGEGWNNRGAGEIENNRFSFVSSTCIFFILVILLIKVIRDMHKITAYIQSTGVAS